MSHEKRAERRTKKSACVWCSALSRIWEMCYACVGARKGLRATRKLRSVSAQRVQPPRASNLILHATIKGQGQGLVNRVSSSWSGAVTGARPADSVTRHPQRPAKACCRLKITLMFKDTSLERHLSYERPISGNCRQLQPGSGKQAARLKQSSRRTHRAAKPC